MRKTGTFHICIQRRHPDEIAHLTDAAWHRDTIRLAILQADALGPRTLVDLKRGCRALLASAQ